MVVTRVKAETKVLTRLIGYLAHPFSDLPHGLSGIKLSEQKLSDIFDIMDSNKVLARVLSFKGSPHFPVKSKYVSRVIEKSRKFRESYECQLCFKRELLNIIERFNEQSIKLAMIKSLDSLPLDSDNIDILLMKKDMPLAFNVLRDAGFVMQRWYREPHKWLFGKVDRTNRYMEIHLHSEIAWDGLKYVDVKSFWEKYREKRINDTVVGFPSPEHHLLTTIAHAFIENRELRLGDLMYLIQDVQANQVDWKYIKRWTIQDRWFDSLYSVLQLADHVNTVIFGSELIPQRECDSFSKKARSRKRRLLDKLIASFDEKPILPIKLPITAVAAQTSKKILSGTEISIIEKAETILHLFKDFAKRRIPICKRHPAFIVCFIGQDGTGKTTHAINAYTELLEIDKKTKVEYVWSRGFGYSLQPFLIVIRRLLLGEKPSIAYQGDYVHRKANLLKREPMRSIWSYIMIVDHSIHLIRVRLALSLGYIVICDRWINDTLIDVKCDLGKPIGGLIERILENSVPQPEMMFIMDTKMSKLAERRPETSPDIFRNKREMYLNCYSNKKHFQVINTADDLQENKQKILSAIIKNFYSKFK